MPLLFCLLALVCLLEGLPYVAIYTAFLAAFCG